MYKEVEKEKAEACAWVFKSPEIFEKYYFLHPQLKPNEVQIRIISSGLCLSDSLFARGKWGSKNYPACCGHEIVGEIQKMGEGVKKFKKGDKVMVGPLRVTCKECSYCQEGETNLCQVIDYGEKKLYGKYWGGYSTHVYTDEQHVFLLPSKVDPLTIPPLMCAGVTTFIPLKQFCKPGMRVGILGCGGLGHMGIQWAKIFGCEVDALSSSNSKILFELGCSKVLNWKEDKIEKDTYDIILNTLPISLSKDEMEKFIDILKPKGKWLQVGVPSHNEPFLFPTGSFVKKMQSIHGSFVGGVKDYEEMMEIVDKNGIKCLSEVFSWDDFPLALEKLEKGKPIFRCVVNVDPESSKYN